MLAGPCRWAACSPVPPGRRWLTIEPRPLISVHSRGSRLVETKCDQRFKPNNESWGYRRIHGELLVLGIKVAASTFWEILKEAGIAPLPNGPVRPGRRSYVPKP